MPEILYTGAYERKAMKFLKKHPDLRSLYAKTLKLLEINPSHPSLRLHAMKGNLTGLYSISLNLTYRITLEFIIEKDSIILIDIGAHESVYR